MFSKVFYVGHYVSEPRSHKYRLQKFGVTILGNNVFVGKNGGGTVSKYDAITGALINP